MEVFYSKVIKNENKIQTNQLETELKFFFEPLKSRKNLKAKYSGKTKMPPNYSKKKNERKARKQSIKSIIESRRLCVWVKRLRNKLLLTWHRCQENWKFRFRVAFLEKQSSSSPCPPLPPLPSFYRSPSKSHKSTFEFREKNFLKLQWLFEVFRSQVQRHKILSEGYSQQ